MSKECNWESSGSDKVRTWTTRRCRRQRGGGMGRAWIRGHPSDKPWLCHRRAELDHQNICSASSSLPDHIRHSPFSFSCLPLLVTRLYKSNAQARHLQIGAYPTPARTRFSVRLSFNRSHCHRIVHLRIWSPLRKAASCLVLVPCSTDPHTPPLLP